MATLENRPLKSGLALMEATTEECLRDDINQTRRIKEHEEQKVAAKIFF